jgi:hypothetical protein
MSLETSTNGDTLGSIATEPSAPQQHNAAGTAPPEVPPPPPAPPGGPAAPPPNIPPSVVPSAFNPIELFTNGNKVTSIATPVWLVLFVIVVAVGLYFGGFIKVDPGSISASNGAAILAIITGTAVVIERILEAFWTFIDSNIGGWWPFSIVHKAIDRLVESFSQNVEPYLNRLRFARDAIAAAQRKDGEWKSDVDAILAHVNAVPDQLTDIARTLKQSGIANDRKVAILTESAANSINNILNTYPDLQQHLGKDVDLAKSLTDDVNSFLNTFDDNPVRRSISLLAGCIAGYAIALTLHLDMFAVLGVPTAIGNWSAGVPLTGLVMGLGSNPTHEVIQAIQQYKQSKQTQTSQS